MKGSGQPVIGPGTVLSEGAAIIVIMIFRMGFLRSLPAHAGRRTI